MSKIYAIYDMQDYEQCVYIGTMKEVSKYLECSENSLRSWMSKRKLGKRNGLLRKRYELAEIIEEDNDDDLKIKRKSDVEIFKELLDVFMPKVHMFRLYKEQERKTIIISNEKWKVIEDFNYSVSNYGRIKNNTSGRIKALRNGLYGYQVNLWNKSIGKMFTLSRLVAHYFIRPVENNERVRHRDGDIRNNYYKNLEIISK